MANVKIVIECEEEYALEALRITTECLEDALTTWPTEGRVLAFGGDDHMRGVGFYYSDEPNYPEI